MQVEKVILAMLGVSLVIVLGSLIMQDQITDYEVTDYDNEFDDKFNLNAKTANMSEDIKDTLYGYDDDDPQLKYIGGAYESFSYIFKSLDILNSFINTVAIELQIPAVVVTTFLAAIGIMFIFGVIYLIFRIRSW